MGEICYGCFSQLAKGGACPHCGYDPGEDIGKYPAALKPGTILNNRYILGRILGQGGFGITYAAQDKRSGERVAIKEYLPTAIASREVTGQVSSFGAQIENFEHGKEGFMEEANALVDFMNNSHIVSVYDLFEANGTVYFVMEYVQGKNLKEYVKIMGGKLGQEAVNRILLPIMEALEDVHSKGLVHRDIAPDNIIVTADGSAKLIDFGAARYSTGEKSLSLDVILKHGFAPKEQYLRRGRQGAFTDVYAMAATYYYAVTGKTPPDALQRMEEDELVSPSLFGAKLSPNVEKALMKALELQPADRYQTMGEFARAIKGQAVTVQMPAPIKPQPIVQPEPVKKEVPPKPENKEKAPAKKKSRKPIILAIAAILAVAAISAGITLMQPNESQDSTEPQEPVENIVSAEPWSFDAETGTLIIQGQGAMEDILPNFDKDSLPWKEYRKQIKKVIIHAGITSIGDWAFFDCVNLTEVIIPSSVIKVGEFSFNNCRSLTEIKMPSGIKEIGQRAFYRCTKLAKIVVPDGVTNILNYTFAECSSLSEIVIPQNVKSIGIEAFLNCHSLTEYPLPNSVTSIGDNAFGGCNGIRNVVIQNGTNAIPDNAFSGCSGLESVVIPNSVTAIGVSAFSGCSSLVTISIPKSVTTIASSAFSGCSSLVSIYIPDSVTNLGAEVFSNCSNLESAVIPSSVKRIHNWLFLHCDSLEDIYYGGNREQWDESLYEGDETMSFLYRSRYSPATETANIHFNYTG